jgi:hypothetical protein
VCECVGGDRVAICPYKVREGGCVACAMGRFWRCATHARAPPRIGIMQRSGRGGMRLERVPTPHPHAPPVRDALAPTMQCNVASVCGGHLSLPPSPTSALQRGTRASRGLAITLHTIYTVHTSVLEWPTVVPPHHNHGCDPCHARHPQTLVCVLFNTFILETKCVWQVGEQKEGWGKATRVRSTRTAMRNAAFHGASATDSP